MQPKLIISGFFLINSFVFNVFAQKNSYGTDFQTAYFTDTSRIAKIKSVIPVIDSVYRQQMRKNNIPGMAFGIVVDGKLIHKNAYGYTNIQQKTPATTKSLFRIASMTKSFTAMAILKLRDAGKLNIDVPASNYFPELKQLKYLTNDAAEITIRQLLTHAAGFPEDNPWGDRQLADSDAEFLDFLKQGPVFSTTSGTSFEYSNLGYAILGKIITNVSGMPYQSYIRQNIWKPLGMETSTWEYTSISPDLLAHGYRWRNNNWEEQELLPDTPDGSWGAMGSMISSVEEFANYISLHLSASPASNKPESDILKRSSLREMHAPHNFSFFNPDYTYPDGRICATMNSYGYGLRIVRDCEQKVYVNHSGGLPGFGSNWHIMPEYGIGIVALGNRTYAPFANINFIVLDTLVKLANLKPRTLAVSSILQQRKAELLKILPDWKQAETSSIFAENFFPDNPIDGLTEKSKEAFSKAGKIITVHEIVPENNLRGTFKLEGTNGNILVYFTLSPENNPLIQAFDIKFLSKK